MGLGRSQKRQAWDYGVSAACGTLSQGTERVLGQRVSFSRPAGRFQDTSS